MSLPTKQKVTVHIWEKCHKKQATFTRHQQISAEKFLQISTRLGSKFHSLWTAVVSN